MSNNSQEEPRQLPDHPNFRHLKAQVEDLFKAGGAVSITDALAITLRPHRSNIRIEFADTGPEALGQIFEPYFSTKETGIGVGLALTKTLIEDHGGQILVTSEVGVGTTFTVILPRDPDTSEQPALLPHMTLNRTEA
jgi:signal transduction histidine kinase